MISGETREYRRMDGQRNKHLGLQREQSDRRTVSSLYLHTLTHSGIARVGGRGARKYVV